MALSTSTASYIILESLMKMEPKKKITFTFSWFPQFQSIAVSLETNSLNLKRDLKYHSDSCLSDLILNGTIGTYMTSTTESTYLVKVNLDNIIIKILIWSDQTIPTIGTLFTELTEQELTLLGKLLELLNQVLHSKNLSQRTRYHFYRLDQLSLYFSRYLQNLGLTVLDVQIMNR